jgi:uncharacterized sporulation protein YeaH/YhbH (DUF444 family)
MLNSHSRSAAKSAAKEGTRTARERLLLSLAHCAPAQCCKLLSVRPSRTCVWRNWSRVLLKCSDTGRYLRRFLKKLRRPADVVRVATRTGITDVSTHQTEVKRVGGLGGHVGHYLLSLHYIKLKYKIM